MNKGWVIIVVLGRIGCNSRVADMGAALRQKGRVSRMKRRGEITNKKIEEKGRNETVLSVAPLLEWRRALRERRCDMREKDKFFCQQQLLATVRWRPPLFDQNHAFLPHFFRVYPPTGCIYQSLVANIRDAAFGAAIVLNFAVSFYLS